MRSDASRLSVETPYFNFALSALGRRADFEPGALRQAITYRALGALLSCYLDLSGETISRN